MQNNITVVMAEIYQRQQASSRGMFGHHEAQKRRCDDTPVCSRSWWCTHLQLQVQLHLHQQKQKQTRRDVALLDQMPVMTVSQGCAWPAANNNGTVEAAWGACETSHQETVGQERNPLLPCPPPAPTVEASSTNLLGQLHLHRPQDLITGSSQQLQPCLAGTHGQIADDGGCTVRLGKQDEIMSCLRRPSTV